MTRRRPRRGGPFPLTAVVGLVAAGVLLATVGGLASSSYTQQTTDRTASADVVADSVGILGLDVAQSVQTGSTTRLVDVTNRLESDVTVTVQLDADSTDKGELVVDGSAVGNRTSFSLATGGTHQVDIDVVSGDEYVGTELTFDVSASAPGLVVETPNRTTTIEDGGT